MTTTAIPDDVTTQPAAKPDRKLGGGRAFGSEYDSGMDVRTYVATHALAGLLADPTINGPVEPVVKIAIGHADALLRELAK